MTRAVTIGLPVFNNAATVLAAVRSVFAQSMDDWTLILVDDGSSDGSLELLRRIDDARVVVLADGHNVGLAARLNQIAELADTALLARMDADDMMHPHRLARQMVLLAESGCELCVTDAVSINEADELTGYRRSVNGASIRRQFRNSPYIHPTVLGRTEWFLSHPYDRRYRRCQDQELWVRTADDRTVASVAEPLLYLREAGTVSYAKYARSMAGTRSVLRDHGRTLIGPTATSLLTASTWARQSAYMIADRFHRTQLLVRSRGTDLPATEQAVHRGVMQTIRATPVPGIDG